MSDFLNTALNWLAANRELFGVPAQNWMLVVGAAVALYIVALIVAGARQPRAHGKRQV